MFKNRCVAFLFPQIAIGARVLLKSREPTSRKPADELYTSFRQTFPEVGPGTATSAHPQRSASLSDVHEDLVAAARVGNSFGLAASRESPAHRQTRKGRPRNLPGQMLTNTVSSVGDSHDDFREFGTTPREGHEPWRLTPSLLDPNSFAFASFANQPPGYYTPTPGGTNTHYHSQAGDLHTPGMGIGVGTPLSLPTSEAGVHIDSGLSMNAFNSHAMQPQHFHDLATYAPQQSFAPSQFQSQPLAFEHMDTSGHVSPIKDAALDTEMKDQPSALQMPTIFDNSMAAPPPITSYSSESFRFHVMLNAPTAMIKRADEIPITYLNKGQAYSISIVDTAPGPTDVGSVRYRTFIRVSFEDEQQRQRPAACWQLWKEGRGTNEAHQRGGRLQAVEFVDPASATEEEHRRPNYELESASFDGFCVNWSTAPGGAADCTLNVRFNFLSTDFSHSKGVKGIPVRLCAKTEVVSSVSPQPPTGPELCFCKVKLFRDHGAERKLSNDVAHVKKTIDKLKQQIAQAESGLKDFGKRKRAGSTSKPAASSRPGKAPKHKRTWSMSSTDSSGGRAPAEDDLHHKLATMQDMFTSTRPASVLCLRGVEQDDPDLHPVHLTGTTEDLTKLDLDIHTWDRRPSEGTANTSGPSSLVSPSSSSGGHTLKPSTTMHPAMHPPLQTWHEMTPGNQADMQANPQHLASPPDQAVKVQKFQSQPDDTLPTWIHALGVDSDYQPPVETRPKPVACFYILPKDGVSSEKNHCYRAIYLMQRTLQDFVKSIAIKCDVDPKRVVRTVHVNAKGMKIMFDDDVVAHLPEGQDMTMEMTEIREGPATLKREWDSGATDLQLDGEIGAVGAGIIDPADSPALELKLIF
ncbi:MAG: hypothetical protein M1817_006752 [Caeruleum heppii]|nr:MAG: hypothetical protein M1817_006752 [Caeruleum heppii]